MLWRIVLIVALSTPTIVFSILFPQHLMHLLGLEVYLLLMIMLLLSPFLPVAVVALQLALPFGEDKWELPTHHSNPLHTGNPLLFIHFVAYSLWRRVVPVCSRRYGSAPVWPSWASVISSSD